MRVLLIDGDIVAYRIACNCQSVVEWDEGEVSAVLDVDTAINEFSNYVMHLQSELFADASTVALSDPTRRYFRHDILPSYKASRAHGTRPDEDVRDHLRAYDGLLPYEVRWKPSLEADDVLGILGTVPSKDERIIVTCDKDLRTIPGLHYNPGKPELGVETETEWGADYNHMLQTLTGDTTDGFKGCPGIGPVKAKKLLLGAVDAGKTWWEVVVDAYAAKGLSEEDALVQAQVARICRASEWDFSNKRVRLWTPPGKE